MRKLYPAKNRRSLTLPTLLLGLALATTACTTEDNGPGTYPTPSYKGASLNVSLAAFDKHSLGKGKLTYKDINADRIVKPTNEWKVCTQETKPGNPQPQDSTFLLGVAPIEEECAITGVVTPTKIETHMDSLSPKDQNRILDFEAARTLLDRSTWTMPTYAQGDSLDSIREAYHEANRDPLELGLVYWSLLDETEVTYQDSFKVCDTVPRSGIEIFPTETETNKLPTIVVVDQHQDC